jgi:hypothetical protein
MKYFGTFRLAAPSFEGWDRRQHRIETRKSSEVSSRQRGFCDKFGVPEQPFFVLSKLNQRERFHQAGFHLPFVSGFPGALT